jgi:predicted RNA-binding Zn ribbon-like protein
MSADETETAAPLLGEPLPVELMNTLWADRDGVHDELDEPAAALRWLRAVEHRLPTATGAPGQPRGHEATIAPDVAHSLRRLRDALRRLAAEVTGDDRPAAVSPMRERERAVAVLNGACARSPSWSELAWPSDDVPRRLLQSRSSSAQAAVSAIAEEAVILFAGNLRSELRACHAPGCVLYFVRDHPRRQWCSGACGNRARVARHYERHHRDREPRTSPTR